MKRIIDTIEVHDPEVEYFIVRALENTNKEARESQFEVYIDDRCDPMKRDRNRSRLLTIYKVENVPADTSKTGF